MAADGGGLPPLLSSAASLDGAVRSSGGGAFRGRNVSHPTAARRRSAPPLLAAKAAAVVCGRSLTPDRPLPHPSLPQTQLSDMDTLRSEVEELAASFQGQLGQLGKRRNPATRSSLASEDAAGGSAAEQTAEAEQRAAWRAEQVAMGARRARLEALRKARRAAAGCTHCRRRAPAAAPRLRQHTHTRLPIPRLILSQFGHHPWRARRR